MRVLEKLSKGLSDAIKAVAKSSAKTLRSVKTDANLVKLNQRLVFFMLHRKGAIIFPDVTAKSNFLSVVNP